MPKPKSSYPKMAKTTLLMPTEITIKGVKRMKTKHIKSVLEFVKGRKYKKAFFKRSFANQYTLKEIERMYDYEVSLLERKLPKSEEQIRLDKLAVEEEYKFTLPSGIKIQTDKFVINTSYKINRVCLVGKSQSTQTNWHPVDVYNRAFAKEVLESIIENGIKCDDPHSEQRWEKDGKLFMTRLANIANWESKTFQITQL